MEKIVNIKPANSMIIPKGETVVFIDPCYLFDNDGSDDEKAWMNFCDQMFKKTSSDTYENPELIQHGILEYKGLELLYSSTAYGDGVYYVAGEVTGSVPVDAGMICVIAKSSILKFKPDFEFVNCSVAIEPLTEDLNFKVIGPGKNTYGVITTEDEEFFLTTYDYQEDDDIEYDDIDDQEL